MIVRSGVIPGRGPPMGVGLAKEKGIGFTFCAEETQETVLGWGNGRKAEKKIIWVGGKWGSRGGDPEEKNKRTQTEGGIGKPPPRKRTSQGGGGTEKKPRSWGGDERGREKKGPPQSYSRKTAKKSYSRSKHEGPTEKKNWRIKRCN